MQLTTLESVKHLLRVGVPLPFNVRNTDHTLLLACGQIVGSSEKMEALFERGMLVDIAELQTPAERIQQASAKELPALWQQSMDRVGQVLCSLPTEALDAAIDEVARPMLSLVERDPDLALFQVLCQPPNQHARYGSNHSMHCAIAALLAAQRMGWDAPDVQRAFKAALTMNVSMLELQGQLATQTEPLTQPQREAIQAHPMQSVKMLELAGIKDPIWLTAVAQHHETGDGKGYPLGLSEATPLAALLHQCDVYTAKLSPRKSREALTADVAARRLFAASPANPTAAALIKEFGLYPPGCIVTLASGETGMVVRRGLSAHAPLVAAMTNERGTALSEPLQRDTSKPAYAIVATLGGDSTRFSIPPEKLMALVCA
jgi:HD-GYP domain-containing protein (c-di-GMP phosphodiesterase class II)